MSLKTNHSKPGSKAAPIIPPQIQPVTDDEMGMHLITTHLTEEEALEKLNEFYCSQITSHDGIDEEFEEKHESALFFIDMAALIRFCYRRYSDN